MEIQKLYSPLYVSIEATDNMEDFDYVDWRDEISQQEAAYYYDEIHAAILGERMPEEAERGLMTYYNFFGDRDDSVNEKARSLFVDVEVHDNKLWGVATIELSQDLTPEELDTLRGYLSGQYSDGWGESVEQHEIQSGNGALYVSFWSSDKSFLIMTEDEFRQQFPSAQAVAGGQRRRPLCPMIGADGNVFNLIGMAANTLKRNGMADAAKEMSARVMSSGSYDQALAVMMEYVEPVSMDEARCAHGSDIHMDLDM